ncbi:TonB-dependent receptor [Sphingorhabdus lutea]|uniref:TonB-dependent receptor n=1 Tax=Sphingorhabdus lutea TaxID=1913578 RepID=A0A1L3JEC0_9SPHN|nr:TonB-dependent receptor [Sphingorhabdus lutea]APG63474.1 TonB-dependent receptor [Sphingorhabdus lutea]
MKRKFMMSAAILAVSVATLSPVYAQETRENAIDALNGEIVVTANKKANVENVQDVALSVTAFNADTLDTLQVRDLGSLSFSAPNVSLDQIGTNKGTANFAIRGLGINSSIPSIDPTVGVFVDGVYMGVNNGVSFDLFDLDSIELLRGPQGILFGRNTTGGAVLVNTGNPTDTFQGKAKISVDGPVDSGRGGGQIGIQGSISGPIIADKLNFKLGAYHNYDRGYFRNLYDGKDFGKTNTVILRGGLEFKPHERVTMLAKGEFFKSQGDGPAAQNHGIFDRNSFDFSVDNRGSYDSKSVFATLRTDIDVDFGDGKITNIFGYRDYKGTTNADIDSTPATIFNSPTEIHQKQYSNELRYAGTFGQLDLTFGGYIFTQDIGYDEIRFIGTNRFYGGGKQNHDVYGVFGNVDFRATDALTVTAGLRWSQEDKAVLISYVRPRIAACSVIDGTCPYTGVNPAIPSENNGFLNDRSWKNWTPKLGLQYVINDDAQTYASWTRAYRSGGYNFRITAPNAFEAIVAANGGEFAFDEERVDSYEAGFKYQTADRKGTFNTAFFLTDIKNMQREVNQSSLTAGVAQSIFNTADARIYGVEVEGRYSLTNNLLLSANIGVIDSDYKRILFDISGDGVINDADLSLALPRVPKLTWGLGLVHDLYLGKNGSLVTNVNFQHRDRSAYTDNNYGWLNASDQLSATLTWNTPAEWLSISIYGKNLLDEVGHGGDTQIPFGGALSDGTNVAFDARPAAGTFSPLNKGRVVGVEALINF